MARYNVRSYCGIFLQRIDTVIVAQVSIGKSQEIVIGNDAYFFLHVIHTPGLQWDLCVQLSRLDKERRGASPRRR